MKLSRRILNEPECSLSKRGDSLFRELEKLAVQAFFIYLLQVGFMKYILGKKIGMTTIYDEKNGAQNVTVIECVPNTVRMVRTKEKDGYTAVQLEAPKTARTTVRRECRVDDLPADQPMGATVSVTVFSVGDRVMVSGITKAKGFQGVVKRHGFSGAPASHGHPHDLRAPGSIGGRFPQHVHRGKRMAGRMGGVRSSSRNLKVISIDPDQNMITVKGAVPGVAGRIVEIRAL